MTGAERNTIPLDIEFLAILTRIIVGQLNLVICSVRNTQFHIFIIKGLDAMFKLSQ